MKKEIRWPRPGGRGHYTQILLAGAMPQRRSRGTDPMTDRTNRTHTRRTAAGPLISGARRGALICALVALTVLLGAGAAHAGEWGQVSCVNPDGSAAGSEGWSSMIAGGGYGSNTDSSCGPGNPAWALLSSEAAVAVGSAETLRYSPPAGSTLQGGEVSVAMHADGYGYNASGTAVAYSPEYAYNSSNVFFQCAAGLTPCAPGSNDYVGSLALPAGRGGSLYLSAGCGGFPGASCTAGGSDGAWSLVQLYNAQLRLANNSTPSASTIAGTLLSGEARGSRELTFTASDPEGPGVYRVAVQADEQTLYSGTPDSNGGRCMPVGGSGAALLFDSAQPCRESESVNETLDTTLLRDGTHTLKVLVTDAAQNTSVVYDATITTLNAPESLAAPSVTANSAGSGGVLQASPGGWTAPAGAGPISYSYTWQDCNADGQDCQTIPSASGVNYAPTGSQADGTVRVLVSASDDDGSTTAASTPVRSTADIANGAGASEQATLTLTSPATLRRAYRRRALTLTGQLKVQAGAPIGNATVEIVQQLAGTPDSSVIGYAHTDADGTFTAAVAAGPSRRLTVGYRAFSADAGYSASVTRLEIVDGSVSLAVTPRRTRPTGTIELSGRVAGPIPSHGVVVELLVHYRGRWVPFRDPSTDRHGRFRVAYSFQGAEGRFPFRAVVPGGQTGFPYSGAVAPSVTVRTLG